MFGIDGIEFLALIVLGIVMFGPEKLPELSRKAARIYVYLRDIANNAQNQLRHELGPEYSDLQVRDLHPKTFISKHLKDEVAAIDEAKKELASAKASVTSAAKLAKDETKSAQEAAKATTKPGAVKATGAAKSEPAPQPVIFDAEAT